MSALIITKSKKEGSCMFLKFWRLEGKKRTNWWLIHIQVFAEMDTLEWFEEKEVTTR